MKELDKDLMNKAKQLLVDAGSADPDVARAAQREIADQITETLAADFSNEPAVAVDNPVREGVMDGDIVSDIYQEEDFTDTSDMRISLDLLRPGTEDEHVAYTMPDHGGIPDRRVEADYLQLNTFQTASSIDCTRDFFRNARYDVLRRMIEVLRMGFVKKDNDDGWRTILQACAGRNIIVYDASADAGVFTPKLTSLMKTVVRRNGGGNSSSINRKRLTDLYMSPEAMEDMTNWGLNLIPDDIRSQIHRSSDGALAGLYDVTFHDLDELGVGQEYQNHFVNDLGGSLGPNSDEELVVGLDLTQRGSAFIRPVSERLQVFEDDKRHREGLVSFYGMKSNGWAVLDTRFVLAGSF